MPYQIDRKLVVAVSSSALFDTRDADKVYREYGPEPYREYQCNHLSDPFGKGAAFAFIRRLLRLNTVFPKEKPVEVIVLSRSDPDTGRRFFASCRHYGLDVSRGAFLCGEDPYPYVNCFNAALFLSINESDVRGALNAGTPAGLVLPTNAQDEHEFDQLRVAFDFDGVLAGDEAEQSFQWRGLDFFHDTECAKASEPLKTGPLHGLAKKLSYWQKIEAKLRKDDPRHKPMLRIAILTARNAPAHARLVRTLE